MKKIVLIAAAAFLSLAASAQDLKFAYVDFAELVQLMPEMDQARATLEENSKANEEILMSMYEEYQKKGQEYQQKASTWTPAILESKQRELADIEARLQQTQQSLQAELQQLQGQLQAPVVEKASLLYVDPAQMIDLTLEARVALNIPEGRTLEQLQQELAAKAQAAQQGM